MLTGYLKDPKTLQRMRSGELGAYIDGFAGMLKTAGYSRWTAQKYIRAVVHLGLWSEGHGIRITIFDTKTIEKFWVRLFSMTPLLLFNHS